MTKQPISINQISIADRKVLINAITLIALGVSILVLDTWGNLFVRVFVGLFWGSFMLVLNGPGLIRAMRMLKRTNAREQRRTNHGLATYERRPSGY
jgi:polyferredoxin